MSFRFRRAIPLEVMDVYVPDGYDLCRLERRMPDGQVFAQIFIVTNEDRKSAATIIQSAKQDVRKRTDAEWVPGRDMLAQDDVE